MTKETDKQKDSQHARFVKKARELGCSENEDLFNATLKNIAKTDPDKKSPAKIKREAGNIR